MQVEEAPGEEEVRGELVDRLVSVVKDVSQEVGEATMKQAQACHLPVSVDGELLMGPHPKVAGAYVATGHGCWGILNAPATGPPVSPLANTRAPAAEDADHGVTYRAGHVGAHPGWQSVVVRPVAL